MPRHHVHYHKALTVYSLHYSFGSLCFFSTPLFMAPKDVISFLQADEYTTINFYFILFIT